MTNASRSGTTMSLKFKCTQRFNVRTFEMSGQCIMYGHLKKGFLIWFCDVVHYFFEDSCL